MKAKSIFVILLMLLSSAYLAINIGNAAINIDEGDIGVGNTVTVTPTLSAEDLYKLDPTNPTQILKQQWREEHQVSQPSVVKSSALQDNLNQEEDFWIIKTFETYPYQYVQITATLLAIGNNSYVYVANSIIQLYDLNYAQDLANNWRNEFESRIYPNDVLYFGSPDGVLGDIDGDPHVTILLCQLDGGVAGYFDPNNEFVEQYSNQREMVYVDYQQPYGVLAHEFQHLIHFNYDQYELTFVDEGCAELARYLSGYVPIDNITIFAKEYFVYHPEDSLLYWNYYSEENLDVRIDYGGAYLFMFYLAEKYGASMIRDLVASTLTGPKGIEYALQEAGYTIAFNQLYLNWITALSIDQPSIGDGLYGFENLDISMSKDYCSIFPTERTYFHRYYGFHITKLQDNPDFVIVNVDPPQYYEIGVSIAVLDSNGWHITTQILKDEYTFFVNGSGIIDAYIISSLIEDKTPTLTSGSDFGVGYSEDLTFSIAAGKPLSIVNYTYNYEKETWTLNVSQVTINDENGTEIVEGMNISVSVLINNKKNEDLSVEYELNYSPENHWFITLNLRSMDEGTYDLVILAEGNQFWGQKHIGTIEIEHIITVTKPEVTSINESAIEVRVNASYTQTGAYQKFINGANAKMVLYNADNDEIVKLMALTYDPTLKEWTSGVLNLAMYGTGDYYITIKFLYGDRVVNSEPSDVFHIEGNETSTSPLALNNIVLLTILGVTAISLYVLKHRRE